MPTIISIEAKRLDIQGINSGFYHLYLVKTVTDSQGHLLSEKVIRGSAETDGSLGVVADIDLAASPDRRGSDTPQERHRMILDLGGRDAEDVWRVMTEHALNIDRTHLRYSVDINEQFPGYDVNSNSVVASVLHSVGLDWTKIHPTGIDSSKAPLYGQLQYMNVNDVLHGTDHYDLIFGGNGNDVILGGGERDKLIGENGNDRLYGSVGNDTLYTGAGDDRLSGGSGKDFLRGGSGKDVFVFNTHADGVTNIDTLRDFSVADDTIWMENAIFTNIGPEDRPLRSGAFWKGTAAHDSNDRIIYDSAHGVLYYDPDGTGAAQQVAFTKISTHLKLTNADFLIT